MVLSDTGCCRDKSGFREGLENLETIDPLLIITYNHQDKSISETPSTADKIWKESLRRKHMLYCLILNFSQSTTLHQGEDTGRDGLLVRHSSVSR